MSDKPSREYYVRQFGEKTRVVCGFRMLPDIAGCTTYGLKGTMSEAELHLLRARLRGGILNRAKRGELKMPLPLGLVYDPLDRVVLDPDAQVQHSLRLLFDTFARAGTACATVKHFHDEGLLFPAGRAADRTRVSCTGSLSGSTGYWRCCTTRDTPAPSRSGATAIVGVPAAVSK